jgi:two-component system, OmpR family, manganese sensing sensor histidine kinase
LVLFAASHYILEVNVRLKNFDDDLQSKGSVMAAGVQYQLAQGKWRVKLENVPILGSNTLPLEGRLAYVRWYGADKKLVRFVKQRPLSEHLSTVGFETLVVPSHHKTSQPPSLWLRQITLPVHQDQTLIGYLQIATSLAPLTQTLDQLRLQLAIGVPIALGVIALTGWWLGWLAMQPIQQSYQQLNRFTTNASHEIRTPLAKVLSHVQLVLMSADELPSTLRWRLERVGVITQSMSRLLGDLLFLARYEGSLKLSQLEPLDLNEMVQELVWDEAASARAKKIRLTCNLPPQPVQIAGEPTLLHQALLNLVDNALKYSPDESWVQMRLIAQPRWVLIQVEDNGLGIPAAALPHLFDRFYRVQQTQPTAEGFGLGLAIAQQIAQAHSGHLTVTSTVGKGTCFELALPRLSKTTD